MKLPAVQHDHCADDRTVSVERLSVAVGAGEEGVWRHGVHVHVSSTSPLPHDSPDILLAFDRDWIIAQKLMSEGRTDAYNYRFNTPDPVQLAANPWEGVMHTSELFFLFQGASLSVFPLRAVRV